jgi:hypothetical protein
VVSHSGRQVLATGHGADDEVGLGAGDDGRVERVVGRLVGQILLAGEETDERPPWDQAGSGGNRDGLLSRMSHVMHRTN